MITKFIVDHASDRSNYYDIDLKDLVNLSNEFEADLYYIKDKKDIASIVFPAGVNPSETIFNIQFAYEDENDITLYCYKGSEQDGFEQFKPVIKMLDISKGEVYFNGKTNLIDSETIDGKLTFTVNQQGIYIITIPSDYQYVGPSMDGNSKSDIVQSYIINFEKDMQFVFKNLNGRKDDAYENFIESGGMLYIDKDNQNGFVPENDMNLYEIQKGGLILIFDDIFLNSLTTGTHTLSVQFSDGLAQATFTVNNPSIPSPNQAVSGATGIPTFLEYKLPRTGY